MDENEEADYLWDTLAMRAPVAFRLQVPDHIPCPECVRKKKDDEVNTHMTTAEFLIVAVLASIAGAVLARLIRRKR